MAMPKVDDIVQVPEDRGNKACRGRVISFDTKVETNVFGIRYVWVTVLRLGADPRKEAWPSHRLGYDITEPKS